MSALHGGDLLILLLDVRLLLESPPVHGAQGGQPGGSAAAGQLQTSSLLEQLLYFVAVYLMISDNNLLAVYGLMENACEALHVSVGGGTPEWPGASGNPTRTLHTCLMDMLRRHPRPMDPHGSAGGPAGSSPSHTLALSAGLSRALCLIHRLQSGGGAGGQGPGAAQGPAPTPAGGAGVPGRTRPRILCVLSAPDTRPQYIATMNSIFSAQRAEVAIDTLMLGPTNSVYLQQAAHLTGGLYMHVPPTPAPGPGPLSRHAPALAPRNGSPASPPCALQHLLSCMAMDRTSRAMLTVNQPLGVDFRASCFCHKTPVDVGHVCSVCLSIFCTPRIECMTCGARFGEQAA